MISRRHLVAAGALAAAIGPSIARAAPKFNLKAILEHEQVPALGVIVVTSSLTKHVEVAGRRNLLGTTPVTASDSWHVGDNTMGVTSAVYARLAEAGKLTWGAKAAALLPAVTPAPEWSQTRLEDLLAHRSGLDDTDMMTADWRAQRYADPQAARVQRAAFAREVLSRPPGQKPGEFRPARGNYILAAALMEQATGQTFEDLAKAEAFDWWGATEAGFGAPLGDAPQGHRLGADGRLSPVAASGQADNPVIMAPASGAHLTLAEYGRFLQLFLNDGGGWLNPKSLSRLARPWDKSLNGYGLGWRFGSSDDEEWAKGPTLTHEGSNGLWRAHAMLAPGRDLGFVAVCNADSPHACTAVMNAAVKAYAEDAPVFNELKF